VVINGGVYPRKISPVQITFASRCIPQPGSTFQDKRLAPPGIGTLDRPAHTLLTILTTRSFSQSFPLPPTHSRCRGYFSLDHSQTHTTVGRTPLDEGSARRRDLYLTTQTLHKRQTAMPAVGFEPAIPASARPQTYALDRAATGIGDYTIPAP
jgi:hypothetical protein